MENTGLTPATLFEEDAANALVAPFTFDGGSFPGNGGTCSAIVSVGSNCTLVVNYSPVGLGPASDTLELTYFNGVNILDLDVGVEGISVLPGDITITDSPTYDFGDIAEGGLGQRTFTLENVGAVDVTSLNGLGLNPPFRFQDGSYPGTDGDCGLVLSLIHI